MSVFRSNRIRMTTAEKVYQTIIVVIVGLIVIACLFPLLYVIGMSFTSEQEMIQRNYFVIIPNHPIVRSYEMIFQQAGFASSLLISVARTVLGTVAALVLTIPGGYILSKKDLPGRGSLMIFFIVTMILSGGLIPSYLLMKALHLINTFWIYIIPAMGGAFNMLIIKMFVEGIPSDIMESADLDGASELQKLTHIAIPLMVPTICALALFAAVGQWNSWFDVMLYIRNEQLYPLSYVVEQLMKSTQLSDITNAASMTMLDRATPEAIKMASVVVAVVPILCVYPFLQKYFIYGVYTGSVKG